MVAVSWRTAGRIALLFVYLNFSSIVIDGVTASEGEARVSGYPLELPTPISNNQPL